MSKNFLNAISEFSQKLKNFEDSEKSGIVVTESADKKLQSKINLTEEERKNLILTEYKNFAEPMSKEIEEDEENLLNAYEFFIQIKELNDKSENTKLIDSRLNCPICSKSEYVQGSNFSYLKIWFTKTKVDFQFVPEIVKNLNGKYCMEFIPKDDWIPTNQEKEILQIIEN